MTRTCLILAEPTVGSARQQLEPLRRASAALRRRGWQLQVQDATSDDVRLRIAKDSSADVVAVQLHWNLAPAEVDKALQQLREIVRPVVFLDHYDASGTPHPSAVASCELLLKKQVPADLGDLASVFSAGSRFGNELSASFDLPHTREDSAAAKAALEAEPSRVRAGWNVGGNDLVRNLLLRRPRWLGRFRPVQPWRDRSLDFHLVAGLGPVEVDDWYSRHRQQALAVAAELPKSLNTLVRGIRPGSGLPRKEYEQSLASAKIVLSPFGYGEICYRDFEAIAAGAVLVKPRVPMMRTSPDVYVEDETYFACAWDFRDLHAVVDKILNDPTAAERVAARARSVLADFHQKHHAADIFAAALEHLPPT
jgi:hypothetical protein